MCPEHFGFREGHPSTHQMMRLVETIAEAVCFRMQTYAFFLYVEQAADGVQKQKWISTKKENGFVGPFTPVKCLFLLKSL